jgi:adenine-specific DNA-methyltransferase
MARAKAENGTKVEGLKHKDKRVNIPTEELRDFVEREECAPQTMLYPRDPSLDPQLVWKGKDEQDAGDLGVSIVPIYIQEKIHPQAIVEDMRAQARGERVEAQATLFADFNGLEFEQLIEFYQHEQNWANRLILGDSLHVMTSLAEKEGLKGKVQMIYIDPPYGIKFGSNWQVSTRKRDVKDGKVEDLTRQPEQIRAFRDTWKLGIHSYLAYLRDRLVVARELLTETGSIFVQIGDENIHLVRCLLDEVFGSENMASIITFVKTSAQEDLLLPSVCDYILWYAKNCEHLKYRQLWLEKSPLDAGVSEYTRVQLQDGSRRLMTSEEQATWELLAQDARVYRQDNIVSQRPPGDFPVTFQGTVYRPITGYWKTGIDGMQRLILSGRIERRGKMLSYVRFFKDFRVRPTANFWPDVRFSSRAEEKLYVVQTAAKVIERCLLMATDPGDLVLDPTCGSGTTAYVAEQWGRRWITIDTSRVALALARTRLMGAKYPYYLLADSPEGIQKECEITGRVPPAGLPTTEKDVKKGFVYKRVPHITLKSIANNDEIDGIHARSQERLEPIRTELNRLLRKSWEEWQIPREAEEKWPAKAKTLLEDWWRLRRDGQKEIDDSIARHAETELLYNDPYEGPKRIRVTGPFTVESLSPHRVLAAEEQRPAKESTAQAQDVGAQFEMMVIENLRKAGVENTKKNERLRFDRLEPYPGTWIQAAGEYTDAAGKTRRVAVSIGPQYGTVPPQQVKEAAKEAVRGLGFDLLVVCGFAFDPHVAEETTRYGKLTVLAARMNADLLIGGEVLKKTRTGNLFMVFGEPDVEVKRVRDGKIQVSVRGVDIYDPTTGEIRSSSTDDIACWFIDTEYNEESFFVRHAYFTGTDQPYEKLKRALRAEVDEAAWASLYSTTSRRFDPPKTGKIAVKVLNHYGDEVLKVYEVKGLK